MPQITPARLEALLRSVRGATMISLVAQTEPAMRKTANPYYGCVWKLARVGGVIGTVRYESSVNRQRLREERPADRDGVVDSFHSQPRAWGVRLIGTPLVRHKTRLYLEIQVLRTLKRQYRHKATGEEIAYDELEPFLRTRRGESRRQQVERPVVLRDYRLSSIIELRMGGEVYTVAQPQDRKAG